MAPLAVATFSRPIRRAVRADTLNGMRVGIFDVLLNMIYIGVL